MRIRGRQTPHRKLACRTKGRADVELSEKKLGRNDLCALWLRAQISNASACPQAAITPTVNITFRDDEP